LVKAIEQFTRLGEFSNIPGKQAYAAGRDLVKQLPCRGIQIRTGYAYKEKLPDFLGERH